MEKGKGRDDSAPAPGLSSSRPVVDENRSSSGDTSFCLNCLIEGDHSVFDVTVSKSSKITTLKELVHGKGINVAQDAILAKDLVLLKVKIDLGTSDEDSLPKLAFTKDDEGVQRLKEWDFVSDYWFQQPEGRRVHIFVKVPATAVGTKRSFDEVADRPNEFLRKLICPFETVPRRAKDLESLIRAPLLEKLPVTRYLFEKVKFESPEISDFLQIGDGELAMCIMNALRHFTGEKVRAPKSEDMLHGPVDSVVADPLDFFSDRLGVDLPIQTDRNRTDEDTTIQVGSRPDFLLWMGDVLLLWGEEKRTSGAKGDLLKKFRPIDPVFFGEVQFMICYTMNRPYIRFYATDGSPEAEKRPDPFIPLTKELDVAKFPTRFRALHTTINIARILLTINGLLPTIAYPLAKRVKFGKSEIFYRADGVEKVLELDNLPYHAIKGRLEFLNRMYSYAKGHRGLVEVLNGPRLNKSGTKYRVELKTRGVLIRPDEESDLRKMVKDLVTGLEWFHRGHYLHRDVRLPNVVYDRTKEEYLLIDFEHGGQRGKGEKTFVDDSIWLKNWDNDTLDNRIYTMASEMYQLGKMLRKEFHGMILSEHGKDFVMRLLGKTMTAQQSLQHEWMHDIA